MAQFLAFWFQLLALTTSNVVYSTLFGSLLPKNNCPHILLAKTEPQQLGPRFWPPTRSPFIPHPIAGSHYLKLGLLHPNRTSSPWWLCFGFWLQLSPSHTLPDHITPPPQTQCTPAKWDHLYLKTNPPTLHWPKTEPWWLGFGFWLQLSPPSCIA